MVMEIKVVVTPGCWGGGAQVGFVTDWEGHRAPFGVLGVFFYFNLDIDILQAVHSLFVCFSICYMSIKKKSAQHLDYPVDSAQCLPGLCLSPVALLASGA